MMDKVLEKPMYVVLSCPAAIPVNAWVSTTHPLTQPNQPNKTP